MKKLLFLICFITLIGCSNHETLSPAEPPSAAVSHLSNDDLDLIDGFIQLTISREDAILRGVPASEYDLVEETLVRHNKNKSTPTKSGNSFAPAWGILMDPPTQMYSSLVSGIDITPSNVGGYYTLYYSFGGDSNAYNTLTYHLYGSSDISDYVSGVGNTSGSLPLTMIEWGYINLIYTCFGMYQGICIYEVS